MQISGSGAAPDHLHNPGYDRESWQEREGAVCLESLVGAARVRGNTEYLDLIQGTLTELDIPLR